MTDRWKNILIGSFALAALAIGAIFVFFLKPPTGDGKNHLTVRFVNIAGINKGTRVTYAGRPVGDVALIEQTPNARLEAVDDTGKVFSYQLHLAIDSAVTVYTSDEIAIRTIGLMGEKSIAIIPKAPLPGTTLTEIGSSIVYASPGDPFDNTVSQVGRTTAKAEVLLDHLDTWLSDNSAPLAKMTTAITNTAESLDKLLVAADKTRIVPSLARSCELASHNLALVQQSLEQDQLLTRTSSLLQELEEGARTLNREGGQLARTLNCALSGDGTLGRLLKTDDFYLRANAMMSKGETLMNDINHYGLLFQYNKTWQRERTKKATLLKSLDTPQEFKRYFEGEIDAMNTSLGRLSELIQKAEQDEEKAKIARSDSFRRDFAQLLRQVQGLSDTLKLYNQELIAQEGD